MCPTDHAHAKYPHGYAVVRIDFPLSEVAPEDSIAVVKVFSSRTRAEEDTTRLNKINADKRCKYVVYVTRMVTDE
jgi:hypothetical protein